ncbi:MAG TPA: hypothetical protein VHM90_07055 [Phycisphaerae bacterium]|jgi:hypothetical protein|nr:hypothetical protein [Phycisphaerae bacterium]
MPHPDFTAPASCASVPEEEDAVLLLALILNQLDCGQRIAQHVCAAVVADPSLAAQLPPRLRQRLGAALPHLRLRAE